MFLVSPLIIFDLWRYRNLGKVTSLLWVLAATIVPLAVTAAFNFPANGCWGWD